MIASTPSTATLGVTSEANRPDAFRKDAVREEVDTVAKAKELKATYKQFVGEAFYGQMLKSMRASVGEPAYFHGGMAERQFQARLDQQMAQELASDGAGGLANQLFEHEFPEQAALLSEASASLSDLDSLRRL